MADCADALDRIVNDGESISEREWRYAKAMRDWCERYLEIFDDADEDEMNIVG